VFGGHDFYFLFIYIIEQTIIDTQLILF